VKSSLYIILLLFLVFGFVNCRKIEPSQRSRILELRQLSKKEVKSKSMQGGLFFGVGGFSSSEKQELYINTIVKTESGFQYFKIPLSKIRINIDNKLEKPFLEMIVDFHAIDDSSEENIYKGDWRYEKVIIHCPEKYLPERLLPIEL